tara:strand:- start:1957 stop:2850 length:894 start_codon:yes stop_codon:yes gene_type:complete
MKLTRRQLRKLIKMVREAFEPRRVKVKDYADDSTESYLSRFEDLDQHDRRPIGMLTHPESETEKSLLRKYHAVHNKEMLKFREEMAKPNGRIFCFHAPDYEGAAANKYNEPRSISGWIQKYGGVNKTNRTQISTVMFPFPIMSIGNNFNRIMDEYEEYGNHYQVLMAPSLILAGYPTMIHHKDQMTQTLTALPQELKDWQKSSGTTKSSLNPSDVNNLAAFISQGKISQETVLDNWKITGLHILINQEQKEYDTLTPAQKIEKYKQECQSIGINLFITGFTENEDWEYTTFPTKRVL